MFFALSGRKSSGKTLFSQELISRNFKKVSFADKLKRITAKTFGWDYEHLVCSVKKEEKLDSPAIWNKETAKIFSDLAEIPFENIYFEDKEFHTKRDALMYLGTDIIRKYDTDWHVNHFVKNYNGENCVIDDMRFKNELQAIKSIPDSYPIFILRPDFSQYSNHSSETSLRRKDFEHVIANRGNKETYSIHCKKITDAILGGNKDYFLAIRKKVSDILTAFNYDYKKAAKEMDILPSVILRWCYEGAVQLFESGINHDRFYERLDTDLEINMSESNCVVFSSKDWEKVYKLKKEVKSKNEIFEKGDKYSIRIMSPFIKEDLKMFF